MQNVFKIYAETGTAECYSAMQILKKKEDIVACLFFFFFFLIPWFMIKRWRLVGLGDTESRNYS